MLLKTQRLGVGDPNDFRNWLNFGFFFKKLAVIEDNFLLVNDSFDVFFLVDEVLVVLIELDVRFYFLQDFLFVERLDNEAFAFLLHLVQITLAEGMQKSVL